MLSLFDGIDRIIFTVAFVMICRVYIFFLLTLLGAVITTPLRAADVRPPFGLAWGELPDRLSALLIGAGAKVVEKGKSADCDVWTVEGLLQPRLKRTLFYFRQSALIEVELQYEDATWDVPHYDTFLGEVRAKIEQLYGPGTLIARQKNPATVGVTETVVGYQWKLDNGSMQLFYFSAEKPPNVFRTVSVHYKAQ